MVHFVVPGSTGVAEHGNGFSPQPHASPLLVNNDAPPGGQAQSPRPLGARDGDNKKVQQLRNRAVPASQSMDSVDLKRMSREERVRYLAEAVAQLVPEMTDVCSQCSVETFQAMRIVVWPSKAQDYDKSFKPDTLAVYDYDSHTTYLFDQFFLSNNILQMSTLFHEYLHSFADNHEAWRKGTAAQADGLHNQRPWETEPIRLENIFQDRFTQRIMSKMGSR